jgi:cellulose synthase/poly-beta-1,6-N-acetylglucosamine synthase-like glycosyltransferase
VALIIFLVASALILYVLFGYPTLLGLLCALRRPTPVRTGPARPMVSVILPVRNGERWIRAKLDSILALDYPRGLLQVIVVDDGSSDRTAAVAESVAGVVVIRLAAGGKALALNAGMARAIGEVLFFTDVRQSLDRQSLSSLVSHLADPSVGVVSGELVILEGMTKEEADVGLYWRYEKWIRKRLSQLDSVMGATGSIYAMRRALAVPLPAGLLVDDMFLPLAAFFKGYRVIFDEEAKAFDQPTRLGSEFSRKVRTLAGNYEIIAAYPKLLLPTTRMWVHFVSHKVGRLLLPWALLAIALATPFLPRPWLIVAMAGQLLVYGSAALDPVMPQAWVPKRLTSLARTFVVMMAAAFVAARFLLPGRKDYWKPAEVGDAALFNGLGDNGQR